MPLQPEYGYTAVLWDSYLAYLEEMLSCKAAKAASCRRLGEVRTSAQGPAAPHEKAEGEVSSPSTGSSLLHGAGNRQSTAVGMSSSPEVPMLPGAICADRPPHSRGEKQKPAQEGLVVRRKYYLTCIVLGKENKGPGTEPGPLASFFFFSFLFFWAIVLVRTIFFFGCFFALFCFLWCFWS